MSARVLSALLLSSLLPRRSYYHNSSRCAFKIELTKTTEPHSKQDVNYEVEFELIEWALAVSADGRATWCAGLLTFLHGLMATPGHCIIDESRFPPFETLYLQSEWPRAACMAGR